MSRQLQHPLIAQTTHDERSRDSIVSDIRMYMMRDVGGGVADLYRNEVLPAYIAEHGAAPATVDDVQSALFEHPYTRLYSTMYRSAQEMIWDAVIPGLERDLPRLIETAKAAGSKFGSLTLDPGVAVPSYLSGVDIHCMPGNYHAERCTDDISAGALYDRGAYIYQDGVAGALGDTNGRTLAQAVRRRFPDFKPKSILDIGATIGCNTLPLGEIFPDAEVHAIDVAAPCLRYAHARAEYLGQSVHFHQMDGEAMAFADNSFDLVTSCILFHETSVGSFERIIAECYRVLKPGGLMLHMEGFTQVDPDPFALFDGNWAAYFNNEPFVKAWSELDKTAVWERNGFAAENHVSIFAPDYDHVSQAEFDAIVIDDRDLRQKGPAHWGGEFLWEMFGAWKRG